jgi:hypothetical protein
MNTYAVIYALSAIAVAVLELRNARSLQRIDAAPSSGIVAVALVLLGPVTLLGMFANWIEVSYTRLEGKSQ